MKKALASREGLTGGLTAPSLTVHASQKWLKRAGVIIDGDKIPFTLDDLFVALPARKALGKWVRVVFDGITVTVPVLDLGPWFPYRSYGDDEQYVFGPCFAQAEVLQGTPRKGDPKKYKINGAGIDLSDGVIRAFHRAPTSWGLRHVLWEFLDPVLESQRSSYEYS